MKLTYRQVGDYLIPNLAIPEENRPIGCYGAMQVIPLFIMAFTVFVVPFVGEWIVERIIDIYFLLREVFK